MGLDMNDKKKHRSSSGSSSSVFKEKMKKKKKKEYGDDVDIVIEGEKKMMKKKKKKVEALTTATRVDLSAPGDEPNSLRLPFHTLAYNGRDGSSDSIPPVQHAAIQEMVRPHIDSFNFMLEEGLDLAVKDIDPVLIEDENDDSGAFIELKLLSARIGRPTITARNKGTDKPLFPAECRERAVTYSSPLSVTVSVNCADGGDPQQINQVIGQVPLMVKSSRCNLHNMTPKQLVRHHEEAEEMGGYFIINGNEKLVRMLIQPRRNFPTALKRGGFKNRGNQYTDLGVMMRCVRNDQTAVTLRLHYLTTGAVTMSFSINKNEFIVPIMILLKALGNTSDKGIYQAIVGCSEPEPFIVERVEAMMVDTAQLGLHTGEQCIRYIGERFKAVLRLPSKTTDIDVGRALIKRYVFVHLHDHTSKFNALVFMMRKLFALAMGSIVPENADSPQNQELLLGGHLYLMILKEKIEDWLLSAKSHVFRELRMKKNVSLDSFNYKNISQLLRLSVMVQKQMENFMATGNLSSRSGLDLQQTSGYTIVADKLNFYRYLSHFRCVHRGAFFTEMRTTTVRKLLPEAWGFLCPVHTPDGTPCGLLNHMSHTCWTVNDLFTGHSLLLEALVVLGMCPLDGRIAYPGNYLTVMLDGRVVGRLDPVVAVEYASKLRHIKATCSDTAVPYHMEIALVMPSSGGQFPGLYLFTGPARMIRPVAHLSSNETEQVGTFEQVYMDIACLDEDFHQGITTHQELFPTSMLSVIASFTPWSDFNQSPRNMYQCQMGKQTMATPCHAIAHRTDNKLYRLMTPQSPIVRPQAYDDYAVDLYPTGTNAIVAVISYTGYDMEDAMILNKASFDRGFAHGTVYKAEVIDLADKRDDGAKAGRYEFGTVCGDRNAGRLDPDGFPAIGTRLVEGDPLYSVIDTVSGQARVNKYKSSEPATIDEIRFLGTDSGTGSCQRVILKLRVSRNPTIGDKFASRAGQKGICSQKWPSADMPFSESGMQPDIIFNPHGFPSRMTIGMMLECMAGKAGAAHGVGYDCTPFRFTEDNPGAAYFGEQLKAAGFDYYGNERLYSGITGEEFEAEIFMGIIYYQRLRHMVSDKYQVRTTGPVHNLTQQPVKGRKRAGGIRFGEMERDSLLAHGVSYLLYDRLMKCSDYSRSHVCTKCGSLLSPSLEQKQAMDVSKVRQVSCLVCGHSRNVQTIALPYVFRYLVSELLAMNVRITLDVK